MKATRLFSLVSVLLLMLIVDAWTWLEEKLARPEVGKPARWRHHQG